MSSRISKLTPLPPREMNPRQGEMLYYKEKAGLAQIQARLDDIGRDHGDTYTESIQPVFDALKVRHFDSSWN
jgi:3-oxoacyl-ACP reductase-like protein